MTNILVVEDVLDIRELLVHIFRYSGYDVAEADGDGGKSSVDRSSG